MFKERPDRFSLCVHGCDHTKGEFGKTDIYYLDNKVKLATARMIEHSKRTGIPFDRIMHFTAGIALAFVFYQFLSKSGIKTNKIALALLAIFIATGIASMTEIMEFIGYSFLGEGEGLLFYGTGDFGEWKIT